MAANLCTRMQRLFFPVYRGEKKLFFPLFFLYFALAFIYNGLRPLKITLVTSASAAGAEIIPFLKVWGIIPGAFAFTYLFTRLSRHLTREQIFYTMLAIFLGYYLLFGFCLYPYSEAFALDALARGLEGLLPQGFRGLIAMLQYWHVSLFYVFCEVWSSAVMYMLFWGYVNEITPLSQAGRFYPLYNLGGNLASTCAGLMLMGLAGQLSKGALRSEPLGDQNAFFTLIIVLASLAFGVVAIFCFRAVNRQIAAQTASPVVSLQLKKDKDKKLAFTLSECFIHVAKSRYLLYLLVLVIAYNLVFNLTDVLWSQQVKDFYGSNQIEMTGFMGKVTLFKGVLSTVLVFIAHVIIGRFGWKKATLLTPGVILGSSLLFFPLIFFQNSPLLESLIHEWIGASVAGITVYLGGLQNALTRGTKYSLYDTTREMAFIPLSTDAKRKGKAVIDGIASRLGKSSGSLIYMILLPFCASLSATIPYVAVIAIGVSVFWVYSIYALSRLIDEKTATPLEQNETVELPQTEKCYLQRQ